MSFIIIENVLGSTCNVAHLYADHTFLKKTKAQYIFLIYFHFVNLATKPASLPTGLAMHKSTLPNLRQWSGVVVHYFHCFDALSAKFSISLTADWRTKGENMFVAPPYCQCNVSCR